MDRDNHLKTPELAEERVTPEAPKGPMFSKKAPSMPTVLNPTPSGSATLFEEPIYEPTRSTSGYRPPQEYSPKPSK